MPRKQFLSLATLTIFGVIYKVSFIMAKSNALSSFELSTVAPTVAPIEVTVKAKTTIGAIRAAFPEYFARPTVKALLAKHAKESLILDTLTGYALHKAHSGMGENEPGMRDVSGLIVYTKDNKKVTAASAIWVAVLDALKAIPNKALGADASIEQFADFAADAYAIFLPLIAKPQKAPKAAAPAPDSAAPAADSAADSAPDSAAPAAPKADVINAAITLIDAMTSEQLDVLQAAITARRAMLTPASM